MFILKRVKVLCFDTHLELVILKELRAWAAREQKAWVRAEQLPRLERVTTTFYLDPLYTTIYSNCQVILGSCLFL